MTHASVYPTMVLTKTREPAQGIVTFAEIEREVQQPSANDLLARAIFLTAKPHPRDPALFGNSIWSSLKEALRVIVEPSPPVRSTLQKSFANKRTSRAWYILEKGRALQLVPDIDVPKTVAVWDKLHDLRPTFLLELSDDQPEANLDAWLAVMRQSMAIRPDALTTTSTISADVHVGPVPAPPTPEQLAMARRDAMLARARDEAWPESDAVGRMLGSSSPAAGRQRATRERAAGTLFGLWSAGERTFYHPRFQFLPDGRMHPKMPELLAALAQIPTYAPEQDPGGWGRIAWLYGSSQSLSERSVAEAGADDGVAPNESELDTTPRTPAEVFQTHPEAVIALACDEAAAIRDRR